MNWIRKPKPLVFKRSVNSTLTLRFITAYCIPSLRQCDLILRLPNGRLVSANSYGKVTEAQRQQAPARKVLQVPDKYSYKKCDS